MKKMTNKAFYISILIFSFLSCKTERKSKTEILENPKTEKIDGLANRYLELNRFSGVILVMKGDTIIYNENFGLANYETEKPFSNNTSFKIGKISEIVTANIITDKAKKGEYKLSDTISKYIPEIKSELTINDLLLHKTSLPTIQTIHEQHPELEYSTIKFANLALKSSDTSEQSDLNYAILELLIEKISSNSFQENLENYSDALGLENTYFQKPDSSLAVGYLYHNYQGNGLELQKAPISESTILLGYNGITSTANDLAKIISINASESLDIHGYTEDDGFSYSVVNNPQTKIGIIVLSNRRHPIAKEISTSIEKIIKNKEFDLPLARKQIAIDAQLLKNYSGFYALNETMNLEVITTNDSLFVMMGPNKIHLIPQSENQFYMEQTDASMRFLRGADNKVEAVVLLDGFLDGDKIKRSKN